MEVLLQVLEAKSALFVAEALPTTLTEQTANALELSELG